MLPILKSLIKSVGWGISIRMDCPFCGGRNTFSISNLVGTVKYYCFVASCSRRGVVSETPSHEEVRRIVTERHRTEEKKTFQLPTYVRIGLSSKQAFDYVYGHNGAISWLRKDYRTAYDGIQNRLMYLLEEDNMVVGAVGRALDSYNKPKALVYPDSKVMPFIVGKSDIGVIVEDCASAASVNSLEGYTGIALLGTEWKQEYVPYVKNRFKRLYVALDPDARKKQIALRHLLSFTVDDVHIWNIPKDFKNMNKDEVKEFIEGEA